MSLDALLDFEDSLLSGILLLAIGLSLSLLDVLFLAYLAPYSTLLFQRSISHQGLWDPLCVLD